MTKNNVHNFKVIRNDELIKEAESNDETVKENALHEKIELKVIENNNFVSESQANQETDLISAINKVKDSVLLTEKNIEVINEDGTKADLERIISEGEYIVLLDKGLGNTFATAHPNELHANLIAKKLKGRTTIKLGTTFSTNLDLSSDKSDPFYIVQDYFFNDDSEETKESKIKEWLEAYPNAVFRQF